MKTDRNTHQITTTTLEEKIAIHNLTEEEALHLEQEDMGTLARDMWNLLQLQKPSVFYTMRKYKTLAPYLIRLEDVMILNVTKLCQTGVSFEEAKKIYLKEMLDELDLA